MKVVYLTQYAIDGQFQSQFHNYSKLLNSELTIKVVYLFPFDENNSLIKSYRSSGVAVSSLNFSGARISIGNLIRYIKFIKKVDADIIHSQHPIAGFYNKIGTTLLNLFLKKKIVIITEQRSVKGNLSKFASILESYTNFLSDLILCSSDSVEMSYFNSVNHIEKYLQYKSGKHFTFYNSIDLDILKDDGNIMPSFIDQTYFNICIVGRLEEVKQPLIVVSAMQFLGEYPVRLYIAGEGSLRSKIQTLINELKLNNDVFLLGNIDWVPALLRSCNVFVNFSKHEGLCKALLEAMAIGKPVIVSKVPGNVEVVGEDSQFGICLSSTDPKLLAAEIIRLYSSNELFNQYSKMAKKRSADFNVISQVKILRRIYNAALGQS